MDQETAGLPDRFILVKKPEDNKFLEWYRELIGQYNLPHYMTVENPDRFFLQTRWNGGDGNTFFFLANVHMHNPYKSKITFSPEITRGRYPWIWDPDTGKRYRITLTDGQLRTGTRPGRNPLHRLRQSV